MRKIFNLILNENPVVGWANSYKTIIAGGLAAIGCATLNIAAVANPQTAEVLMQVSHYADIAAGYLGVVGVCGKIVKKG